ncbi:MAG: single-stranded-DNA-specific exonuclease RecJ [Christensenellales bacterium]|jgi:single-stranded-DNA-specific exonuclease
MLKIVNKNTEYNIEGLPKWMSTLLYARGIKSRKEADAFLSPDLNQLYDPYLLSDMHKAVSIINNAKKLNKRIVIYGDYDVDGICASVILHETLRTMGIATIIYIPDRFDEGYGLNEEAVTKLSKEADILISVDCGITSATEVELAKKLGMQVIITDHHTLPNKFPAADAIISQLIGDYPFKSLCGAALAWKLSAALKGMDYALAQIDLCALATVADMVPLLGENRVIVSYGLKQIERTKREGLIALKTVSGIAEGGEISSEQVAYYMAPRLNASGRLSSAKLAVELLMEKNPRRAFNLAGELDRLNSLRRQEENNVLSEAKNMLKSFDSYSYRSIVVAGENWNSGVLGLVAGKIAEFYNYPTVVLSIDGENCVGSARSAGDINLYEALNTCSDIFTRFGGHEKAAGLSINKGNIEAFIERFDKEVKKQLSTGDIIPQAYYDFELDLNHANLEMVESLYRLAPFGIGNPEPQFLSRDVNALYPRAVGTDGKHLKLVLQQDSSMVDAIAFNKGDKINSLRGNMDALYTLDINKYMGKTTVQCKVKHIISGDDIFTKDMSAQQEILLQDLILCLSNSSNGVSVPYKSEAPKISGIRGTLLFCRTYETATRISKLYPDMDRLIFDAKDVRLYNSILYSSGLGGIKSRYKTVYLCDGVLHPKEANVIKGIIPEVNVIALERTQEMSELLRSISVSIEELREGYISAKQLGTLDNLSWNSTKKKICLYILDELKLISLSGDTTAFSMLPMKKCDPMDSKLFNYLSKEV